MPRARAREGLAAAIVLSCAAIGASGAEGFWAKGNTHAHSTISDGNASPDAVIKWYKHHGYQFLVLTDHDKVAPMEFFDRHTDASFVAIPGVELSATRALGDFNVHINALGITAPLEPIVKTEILPALTANMEMVARAGAVIQLNHPSFYLRDRTALSKVSDTFLMEVYNHATRGDRWSLIENPLFEHAYEAALTAGKRAYAVASDDTHDYQTFGPKRLNPGGGWVMVRVAKLTRDEILKNLAAGKFYASSGPEIDEYTVEGKTIRVRVKPADGVTYTIWFLGHGGMPLAKVAGTQADYRLRGSSLEKYVRVRVHASDDTMAWMQPVWPEDAARP
ncbi:MAG: PHP domain-containing protein [Phycisphaerae bacterium]|nr:PHP domain-containing protein [Phycisphaerae bacterium]